MKKLLMWIIGAAVVLGGGFFMWQKTNAPAITAHNENIRIAAPMPNGVVVSPLTVAGEARGTWYFEASFPVELLDADRNSIAIIPAQAEGEWMTEGFVPFTATLDFTVPATDTGFVVFKKDNPSGLPEHDASVEVPVRFR